MQALLIGGGVTFVDERGLKHPAVITNLFWNEEAYGPAVYDPDRAYNPSINVVYVTEDVSLTDPYGRQIVRKTSVPAKTAQPASGYYWLP